MLYNWPIACAEQMMLYNHILFFPNVFCNLISKLWDRWRENDSIHISIGGTPMV